MKNNKEFGFHQAIKVRIDPLEKYKYKLTKDVFILIGITGCEFYTEHFQLTDSGMLIIDEKYAWDGATGAVDNAEFLLASLVHDVLYQALRSELLSKRFRKKADQLLRLIGQANGMSRVRSWYSWAAVRLVGWRFTRPENQETSPAVKALIILLGLILLLASLQALFIGIN